MLTNVLMEPQHVCLNQRARTILGVILVHAILVIKGMGKQSDVWVCIPAMVLNVLIITSQK